MSTRMRSRAKRVVFVNRYFSPDQSATSQILTDLARGLAAHTIEVHVVCSRQLYDDASARLTAAERLWGVNVHRVATTRFGRLRLSGRILDYASFYLTSSIEMMRLTSRGDVIIAKTDPPLISIPAALIARLKGAVLINWQQDVFPEVASRLQAIPLPGWIDRVLRQIRDASLRSAHMNVVVGSGMLDYLHARGIPMNKLCVIENWADSDSIVPKPTHGSRLRSELGLGDKFVVGYSGNLGRAHEYEAVLGAAEALRDDPSIMFVFIGGGAKMEKLKAEAAARGLPNIQFLPYQPRESLEDSLAASDAHLAILLPSLEGLIVPSKFYGILAAGRPVLFIGHPDGELARVIRAAQCGLVIGVGESADLVSAIRRLQQDEAGRQEMGRASRRLLSERYSAERGVSNWIGLIGGFREPRS
jgi:colanic acid biosynthesis glycosyl transferase WcaI